MSNPNVNAIPTVRSRMNVRTLVSLAMLTGIAYVVMLLSKILPQVYNFLQLDVKDTVICIGGFVSRSLGRCHDLHCGGPGGDVHRQ